MRSRTRPLPHRPGLRRSVVCLAFLPIFLLAMGGILPQDARVLLGKLRRTMSAARTSSCAPETSTSSLPCAKTWGSFMFANAAAQKKRKKRRKRRIDVSQKNYHTNSLGQDGVENDEVKQPLKRRRKRMKRTNQKEGTGRSSKEDKRQRNAAVETTTSESVHASVDQFSLLDFFFSLFGSKAWQSGSDSTLLQRRGTTGGTSSNFIGSEAAPWFDTKFPEQKLHNSSNKVLFATMALRGHATPLIRLAKELSSRGYEIHFATHTRGRDWIESAIPGVKFVSFGKFPLTQSQLHDLIKRVAQDTSSFHGIRALFNELYLPNTKPIYRSMMPIISSLQPAAIVSDIAALGALDAAAQSNTPLVVNNPTLPFSLESPLPWLPAWGTGLSLSMSLWEKCMNTVFPRLLSIALTPPFITLNKQRWSLDLPTFRSQHDIFRETRILVNSAFGFDHARALPPLSEMVGVIMPPEMSGRNAEVLPISPLIKNWLHGGGKNQQYQGVVLVSIGRMAHLEPWQAEEITKGLTDPRFRVLWIVTKEGRARSSIPSNLPPSFRIKSIQSVPRLKILADPSVRAVVMHCGLGSVQEALYFGKPVLCIPYLADQSDVGARLEDSGAGKRLSKFSFDADEVKSSVLELFGTIDLINEASVNRRHETNLEPGNSSYAIAARKVGQFLRLAGGVRRAGDIVEATINAGSSHLRTYSLEQPWHKVLQADVYAVYAGVICLMAVALHLVICLASCLWVTLRNCSKSSASTRSIGDETMASEGSVNASGDAFKKKIQ